MENLILETNKVKKLCVIKRGNKWYMPETIPKERNSLMPSFALIIVLLLLGFYSAVILFYIICYITFYRLLLLLYERKHLVSIYKNDKQKLFHAAFSFQYKAIILIVLCMVYASGYGILSLAQSIRCIPWTSVWVLFFLHHLLGLNDFPINDSLLIAKNDGLDYGSGMAYSFFYGYLNYILNRIGEPGHTLKDMMQVYESNENINFAMYKIFILIPKSLTCHEQIDDVSRIMEMRKSLLEKKITVAGVRDRIYKNSVYSIQNPYMRLYQSEGGNNFPKKIWVCAEYATPLKTFQEVIKHSTAHAEFYNRHINDILLQFYLTLEEILERTNMSSMCELVFYEDSKILDGKTHYYDIGKILLSKISELKKNERPKDE
ncbi:stimulator of interferon genes protein isoform X2 [Anthonomus grandis grandis]|uniref:stimulator of interferon genes protein isoform X2 n=1 Tax=Anthonomus grandis grandis TaxID=2921223 RepID=UPI0021655BED|nr:stimulator of interferon genes protein isoform X2 [Anthonomus grandis grandis]